MDIARIRFVFLLLEFYIRAGLNAACVLCSVLFCSQPLIAGTATSILKVNRFPLQKAKRSLNTAPCMAYIAIHKPTLADTEIHRPSQTFIRLHSHTEA